MFHREKLTFLSNGNDVATVESETVVFLSLLSVKKRFHDDNCPEVTCRCKNQQIERQEHLLHQQLQ